jgi:endonuclease/exonuclease/phosphatase family metal-dependent hydrolase
METFFDAVFDGNEYKEFSSSRSGWCESKYRVRLERAASVIKKIGCDVVVLEEMEKSGQLRDISNQLSATFSRKSVYRHGFFAAEEGASIGCGILSRYPIESHVVRELYYGSHEPRSYGIVTVTMDDGTSVALFNTHLSYESDEARLIQIKQIAFGLETRIPSDMPAFLTGDFNTEDFRVFAPE